MIRLRLVVLVVGFVAGMLGVVPVAAAPALPVTVAGAANTAGDAAVSEEDPLDFNGDGYGDLVVGVPGEDDGSGVVNVIYGSEDGLSPSAARPDQIWGQGSPDVQDNPEPWDGFGHVLAAGDFGNHGWDDLAIGVPFEDGAAGSGQGGVNVIYGAPGQLGAPGGLSATEVPDQLWAQAVSAVEGTANVEDHFGKAFPAPVTITSGWMLKERWGRRS